MSSTGAQNVHSYTLINAVSATVSPAEEAQLKANPAVSEVLPDAVIRLRSTHRAAPRRAGSTSSMPSASRRSSSRVSATHSACRLGAGSGRS